MSDVEGIEGIPQARSVLVPAPEVGEGAAFAPTAHRALEVLGTLTVAGSREMREEIYGCILYILTRNPYNA